MSKEILRQTNLTLSGIVVELKKQRDKLIAELAEANRKLVMAVEAMERVKPWLPVELHSRHSEHCQAAQFLRETLAKLKGD